MQAVILAAGDGGRMGGKCKALCQINNESLIRRLCRTFKPFCEIIVVTSYCEEKIQTEIADYVADGTARLLNNDKWYETDNGHSLSLALFERLDDSFVVNADTVFDEGLIGHKVWLPNTIAVEFGPHDAEAMQVKTDRGRVSQLSKNIKGEGEALVYYFSRNLLRRCREELASNRTGHFENTIDKYNDGTLSVMDIYPFRCVEIDTEEDYEKAKKVFEQGEHV